MALLDGRRAMVTGGGSGIGRGTCRRFAEEGARVAVREDGPRSIRVNAVAPGAIRSAMTTPLLGLGDWEQRWTDRTPLGRVGEPTDIADVVVFLCSDLARYITGQVLVVDGGMILHGAGIDGVLDYVMGMLGAEPPPG